MGLIGAQGSVAAQAQIERQKKGGRGTDISHGQVTAAMQIKSNFRHLQSRYGLKVALNILEAGPPPQDWIGSARLAA